jgi:site-specific DNA-cytosine methylase
MATTFIDLFAGIGGFHAAGSAFGWKCVFANEIDPAAAAIYKLNWKQAKKTNSIPRRTVWRISVSAIFEERKAIGDGRGSRIPISRHCIYFRKA